MCRVASYCKLAVTNFGTCYLCFFNESPTRQYEVQNIRQLFCEFDVCKSVHHRTIQMNQPTRCNSFTSLLLDVYVWLNMLRALPRPSPGAYNCYSSLWFYRWSVVVAALLDVVWPVNPNGKTRGC